ncbi:hypothetical protein CDD81_1400 [Ophiocordyceps australis]|uniref:YMC020W-like alpha/beta hydrolase domain-containing protein n=1 Tax=Ophiocordyceps australis TaxID=1399860 RepID=A0A2C5XZP8_9HYPO|nr:hypothetical protein CDD81_1400 [Ophiocordyceps australis]
MASGRPPAPAAGPPTTTTKSSLPTTAVSREVATSHVASVFASYPLLRSHGSIAALSSTVLTKQVRKSKSWYGSWPRAPIKAAAQTAVARENILGDTLRSVGLEKTHKSLGAAKSLAKVDEHGKSHGPPAAAAANAPEPGQQSLPDEPSTPLRKQVSSSWLGWWSTTPLAEEQDPSITSDSQQESPPPRHKQETASDSWSAPQHQQPADASAPPAASWFGFWSVPADDTDDMKWDSTKSRAAAPKPHTRDAPPKDDEPAPKAGSTWAFWTRDSTGSEGKRTRPPAGEMAVMGERSEMQPQPMAETDVSGPSKPQKRGRPSWRRKNKRQDWQTPASAPRLKTAAIAPVVETERLAASSPNLLLPSFADTYGLEEPPSVLQQLTRFLLRTPSSPPRHVVRARDPPRIRRALAIGVHGLFPATYLRPMTGQPTGTSLRFASLCADALRQWADAHGCTSCEIEKVALEGEGRIAERVDNLWRLLLNWIDHIRRADVIVVACHSQGVPVSVMLVERLIALGVVTDARLGICAMAGVTLGPFSDYRSPSSILMGAAGELWEFADPASANSKRFEAALRTTLEYGARVTFVGSIDDQVVPLDSAIYSPATHPYIYRAVFVDGRIHTPDFMSHLVAFALRLRNLGVSDHGLVHELSLPLAGSLVSGEGHSRLYYDPAVYALAVMHALESASTPVPVPCAIARAPPAASSCSTANSASSTANSAAPVAPPLYNPYVLPWIMRGVLEEQFVRSELKQEADELLRLFDDWKPVTKALRDVKYRLEAVRSKL